MASNEMRGVFGAASNGKCPLGGNNTMSSQVRILSVAGLLGACALLGSVSAEAAGFQLREQSSEGIGNSFAGSAAKALTPATIWYNPAGMTLLDGNQIAGSLTWIAPQARFSGTGTSVLGGSTGTKMGGDAIDDAAVGATYAMWSYSKDLKFGLAVTSPYGLRSSYPSDWAGRYYGVASSVTSINVNPNVAYRINPNLSIGAGVQVQWTEADLSSAVNQAAICLAGGGGGGCLAQTDGYLRVKGDHIGVGYNVGVLYEFTPTSRVGLAYRSAIRNSLTGSATTTGAFASAALPSGSIHADFTVPDTATLSVYHELTPQWAVMADVQWTHWSTFKDLSVYYDANGKLLTSTNENWRDTWVFSLGANYKMVPGHTLHFGAAYDMGAVKSADYRTPRIPDTDRVWLSTGYTWDVSKAVQWNIGYAHIFAKEVDLSLTSSTLGKLSGTYNGSVDMLSSSFVYKF
jgi:long-chain fatty acid transport protein